MNTLKKITNYITEKGREAKNYGYAVLISAPFVLPGCMITNVSQETAPLPDFHDSEYVLATDYLVRVGTPKGNKAVAREMAKFSESDDGFKNTLTFLIPDTVVNGENLGRKITFIDYDYLDQRKFTLDSIVVNSGAGSKKYSMAYLRAKFPEIADEQQEQYIEGLEFMKGLVEQKLREDLGGRVNNMIRPSRSGFTTYY